MIYAIFEEFGTELESKFASPTKEDLLNSSKHHPLPWDSISHVLKTMIHLFYLLIKKNLQFQFVKKQLMHIPLY